MPDTTDRLALQATVLGAFTEWAGDTADLDDCREASAHVAAVLVEAGVGFVAEAEQERAEAALADLRSRIEALADEWEASGFEVEPDQLRALLDTEADR